jgi:hypothetical protein
LKLQMVSFVSTESPPRSHCRQVTPLKSAVYSISTPACTRRRKAKQPCRSVHRRTPPLLLSTYG